MPDSWPSCPQVRPWRRKRIHAKNALGLTVVELADAYWQFCQGHYRKKDGIPGGWQDHIHLVLHTHQAGLYGQTPAADFGPKAFKAIRQTLVDAGNCRPYVNKLMPIITRCFKWGASEELIPAAVYHGLTTVEGLRKRWKADHFLPCHDKVHQAVGGLALHFAFQAGTPLDDLLPGRRVALVLERMHQVIGPHAAFGCFLGKTLRRARCTLSLR
jgi:hypothetical protein